MLVDAGADLEAKDAKGRTALEVALLSGWQNIAGARARVCAMTPPGARARRVPLRRPLAPRPAARRR